MSPNQAASGAPLLGWEELEGVSLAGARKDGAVLSLCLIYCKFYL